jgi:hypothetical protein
VRWYDETHPYLDVDSGLVGVSSQNQSLAQGQGFAAWSGDMLGGTAAFQVDVTGAPHIATSPITLPMTYTNNGDVNIDGWNLVSNPLPSAIAFDQVVRGADVEDEVTYYNPANGTTAYYSISMNMGSNGGTNVIQSSQGFFLHATGGAVTTTVSESAKVNSNAGGIFGGDQENTAPASYYLGICCLCFF